ncbi:MAG TPA: recombinase family protein, partial [Thermomicrobiales bacterium]|nr:recombinase family protein [Thermomicrobiales bacterium]
QRMATGCRARAKEQGKLLPGGHPLYGYQWDDPSKSAKTRHVEDEAVSWIVRRVFEEAASGVPLRRIAMRLNDDGMTTTSGKRWQARQISRMLANPAYKGQVYANRYRVEKDEHTSRKRESIRPESEWVLIKDAAPPLISAETWQRANERLAKNRIEHSRPYDKAEDALLRAGFIYCAYCGNRMNVSRRRHKIFYKCNSRYWGGKGECKGWSVKAGPVDQFVWGRVEGWLGDPGVLFHEAERSRELVLNSVQEDLGAFDRGLAKLESEQDNLVQALTRLSGSAAHPVVEKLNALATRRDALVTQREEALRRSELAAKAEKAMGVFWDTVRAYGDGVGTWGYAEKRELLHRLGVRLTVEKRGRAQGKLLLEANPPWPEGTEWWMELFNDSYHIEAEIGPGGDEDGDGEGGVTVLPSSDQISGKWRSIANRMSSLMDRMATGTRLPSARRVSPKSSIVTM